LFGDVNKIFVPSTNQSCLIYVLGFFSPLCLLSCSVTTDSYSCRSQFLIPNSQFPIPNSHSLQHHTNPLFFITFHGIAFIIRLFKMHSFRDKVTQKFSHLFPNSSSSQVFFFHDLHLLICYRACHSRLNKNLSLVWWALLFCPWTQALIVFALDLQSDLCVWINLNLG